MIIMVNLSRIFDLLSTLIDIIFVDTLFLMQKKKITSSQQAEAKYDLAEFARIVNSCDVMLGIHGAGLTNLVFLPMNAVVIQVIPLGGLKGISWIDFELGTISMKMNYLQYTISIDESSLTEQYSRGDLVLSDMKEAEYMVGIK